MKYSNSHLGRFAAGCLLISSLGMLAGCRSAQVKMPCWPWENSGETYTEPTPAQPSYHGSALPAPSGELLPAPPEPSFGTPETDPTRVPPAPAPMPDELAPTPILPEPSDELPPIQEEAQDDSEEYLNIPSETSLNLPEKKSGRLFSRKILSGHVPLKDRSHAAVELDSSSSALSGEEPKVESGRRIHRTLFR